MFKAMVGVVLLLVISSGAAIFAQEPVDIAVALPTRGAEVTIGEPLVGQIGDDDPIIAYQFEAEADVPLTLFVQPTDETFFSTFMIVYDAAGEVLADTQDDLLLAAPGSALLPVWSAPEDGTYFVAVSTELYALFEDTGMLDDENSFTLSITEAEFATLDYGTEWEVTFAEDQVFALAVLEVERTDIVTAQITASWEAPAFLTESLTRDDFSARRSNGFSSRTEAFLSPVFIRGNDRLVFIVEPDLFEDGGEFTLTAQRFEPAPITPGEPVTVELGIATLSNFVAYEGEEGQVVGIIASASTGLDLDLVVYDPDGQPVAGSQFGEPLEELELVEDGTYTILIIPADFSISLEELGEVTVTLTLDE
jgi:hypothetical protein